MNKIKSYRYYEFINSFDKIGVQPAYLIYGEESYLKDSIRKMIVDKYSEAGSDDFDLITFYGDEYPSNKKPIEILEQLDSLPFLTKRKIIILKKVDAMPADNLMMIAKYLEKPAKTSILIMSGDKIDKRIKANKIIVDAALNIQCYPPYNASNIAAWLRAELQKKSIRIDSPAADLFANSIELDYMIASTELEKLIIYTKNSGNITIDDVEETVGKSRKNKIFDLQNSIGNRNLKSSITILENMFSSTTDKLGIYVVTMIMRYFITLWKITALREKNQSDSEISSRHLKTIYFKFRTDYMDAANNYSITEIKKIFSLLLQSDYDLKSKNLDEKIIIEPMIINICNIK
jgi:DNA polymerase-3 subunit delta